MFTSQKIGRTVFVSLYFDKIFYYANALDGMYVNAHKKWPSHKFLVCTSLLFNKNNPQVAARATRLQWLKIEQKHRMTSSTWLWGCRTKWVIGHRTWSIIGHSTIWYKKWLQIHLEAYFEGFFFFFLLRFRITATPFLRSVTRNNRLPLITGAHTRSVGPPADRRVMVLRRVDGQNHFT